ncbi:MAG: SDR family NAD(P)-dependent oxidoreductase [Wujia sp.]
MKTMLITGASGGIGAQTVRLLANEYDVIGCIARSKEQLDLLAQDPKIQSSCRICTFTGDVSNYNFVKQSVDALADIGGGIDTIINNAGQSYVGLLQDMTPEQFRQIFAVNVDGYFNTCHAAIPYMLRRQSGKIINISSVWGLTGAACEVAYCATKGAINSFTQALAKELAPSNIQVNAIAFGAVDTAMNEHLSAEEKRMLCDEISIGRMAEAEEAAACIQNVLHMPAYMTGEIIKMDGAWI